MPSSVDNVARRKAARPNSVPGTPLSTSELMKREVAARAVVSKMKKPKFASEAEEADWYPAHPEYVEALFKQARAEGKLGRGNVAKILGFTTPVTIRLSQTDIAKAKLQAEKKGIGYQTYIKMLLHEALAK
jgi:predicted DNA binding CopG/RHH family protein